MTNPLYDTLFGAHAGGGRPFLHLPGGWMLSHDDFPARAAQAIAEEVNQLLRQ